MTVNMTVHLLEREFFPKWIQALFDWLSQNPDFEEVSQWYLGWKQQFSAELREEEKIKIMFNYGLDLMNASLEDEDLQPLMREIRMKLTKATSKPHDQARKREPAHVKAPPPRTGRPQELTFRETIERLALSYNLSFSPTQRSIDGKTIFEFNQNMIYLDKNNVYLRDKKGWKPVSLPDLLAICGVRL